MHKLRPRQIAKSIPLNNFFFQIKISKRQLNSTKKLIFLKCIVSPNCYLKGFQPDRLDRHSIFEGFHETWKTTFLYHFSFPFCYFRTIRNEISFYISIRLLTTGRYWQRSCMMYLIRIYLKISTKTA